jgi:hypothetical protein
MSEPEARGPEDHDAPLPWRAPSDDMIPNDRYVQHRDVGSYCYRNSRPTCRHRPQVPA